MRDREFLVKNPLAEEWIGRLYSGRETCYTISANTERQEADAVNWFKKAPKISFDPEKQEPAVRRSICTGEMTVGLIDRKTGRFQELMRVNGQRELEAFCSEIGVREIKTIY